MAVRLTHDPRDLLPSILSPQVNMAAPDATAYIQRETGIDGLRVLFNREREKFVIMDDKAPGGPAAAYVMIVQNPDGTFRTVDERTVQTLRKLYGRHAETADELKRLEAQRERERVAQRQRMSAGFADDFKWIGKDVTPSVTWRDRTDPDARARIRREAGLE